MDQWLWPNGAKSLLIGSFFNSKDGDMLEGGKKERLTREIITNSPRLVCVCLSVIYPSSLYIGTKRKRG